MLPDNDEGRRAPVTDAGDLRNDETDSTPAMPAAFADAHAERAYRTWLLQALAAELGVVAIGQALVDVVAEFDERGAA